MIKKIISIGLGIAFVLTSALAWAGMFDREIMDQQRQIDKGKASGKLTRGEAATVQDNLKHIKSKDRGRLTERDKEQLREMLQRNERMINKLKDNDIRKVY
jgi:polyhydroxyalkanoate synthesis regulator phasin